LALAVAMIVGCTSEPGVQELVLDGPREVRVQSLGPVPAPRITTTTGEEPHLIWQFSRPGVVELEGDRLVAKGPGEVDATAEWEGSAVTFAVVVQLDSELLLPSIPARLSVGETRPLEAAVRVAGDPTVRPLDPSEVQWTYEGTLLRIEGFEVTGLAPGITFVTARSRGAQAMAEIEVVAGP
jgi:hypothetical protein